MTVRLPKVGNSLLEEMNPQRNYIIKKKHVLTTNVHGGQKRRVKKFLDGKRIWKTQD